MTILGDQVLMLKLQIYSIFLWYTEVNLESLFFYETWRFQKKHVFKPDENMITLFKLCFRKDAIWQEKKTLQNMSQILK